MNREYYLGLDMGTSSVGWAVTDENYNLLRAKGKDLWGIREFDEAVTAAGRRSKRVARRRRQRECARNGLVKLYFADEIEKIDPLFFVRLENSKYHKADKDDRLCSKFSIFDDANFKDSDYYKKYPTIYHLRKAMLYGEEDAFDIRLVYLAVSNLFKRRGHFLLNGVDGELTSAELESVFERMTFLLADNFEVQLLSGKVDDLIKILGSKDNSRSEKLDLLKELFNVQKNEKRTIAFLKVLCGLKVDVNVLFEADCEEKCSIEFSSYSYTDSVPTIQAAIGDDNYEVVELMKLLYDYAALSGILGECDYLSEARVATYEKHAEDLKILKSVYKKHLDKAAYDKMFRSDKEGTYSAYVNSLNSNDSLASEKKYRRNMKGRSAESLYDTIKKDLKAFEEDDTVSYILDEIEKGIFLPKQLTGANGVIPNQIHRKELAKILQNAERFHPFLLEEDEYGNTVSDRIVKLFAFQIPYYVGPVGEGSKTGWAKRKSDGPVLPWNISERIDLEATSEEFINRLIKSCTYLNDEKVLPKSSLLYESFCVLNEINNLCINGDRIPTDLKQGIYNTLFKRGKKVTRSSIVKYLMAHNALTNESELTGIDVSINNALSSYGKMYAIFGDCLDEEKYRAVAEDIIYWGTIYGDSKEMFSAKIDTYVKQGILSETEKKRVLGYKFKDWGRLSRNFLEMQGCDYSSGEVISLIGAMWDNSLNMMELINSNGFSFKEILEEKRNESVKSLSDFTVEDLDEYYFSAPVKRMIWQTFLIIRELETVLGQLPKKVFVKMTRSDEEKGDKGRKESRGKQLLELYKSIPNTEKHNWKEELKEADESGQLRSKKLFLYYSQMGRDMYTGKEIDIEELFTTKYDIDHVYPRHFVKDDSIINNLVLVNKADNEHVKKDFYPIPKQIADNPMVKELWETLHVKKLISDEKYHRLVNRNPFSEDQLAGFIARQLVETSQGTKGISDLIKALMPSTEVVYSKASLVSEFRRDNDLPKTRILNEFHHANDAYLNIVVGNVYYTKFTQNPLNFIQKEYARDIKKNNYHLSRMFDWNVERNGYIAWVASTKNNEGTIAKVRSVLAKNTPLMTRLSYEKHGAIANETLYSAKKAKEDNYFPLKTSDLKMSDVTKYGGYTSATIAYYFIVEHTKSNKKVISIEGVPIYKKYEIETNQDGLKAYAENELGLIEARILVRKLKIQSLIKVNDYYMYISGKTGNRLIMRNAVNLCLDNSWRSYIRKLENVNDNMILHDTITKERNVALFEVMIEKHTRALFTNRPNPIGEKLIDAKDDFAQLSVQEQCFVLNQILQLTSVGVATADLTLIGGASMAGKMLISKNIDLDKDFAIVNQSVTGLYEKTIHICDL